MHIKKWLPIKFIANLSLIVLLHSSCAYSNKNKQINLELEQRRVEPTMRAQEEQNEHLTRKHTSKRSIKGMNIALPIYEKEARKGDPLAQYSLGMFYLKGFGVKKDYEKAVMWFHNASKQNYPSAQYSLARCYQEGLGVKKNYKEAAKLFEQAAAQGHKHAQKIISEYYRKGLGVEKNLQLADYWLQKSTTEEP